jgi:hypothetical protein
MSKFAHLQRHDPRGRKATFRLPIEGHTAADGTYTPAALEMRHAGESNRAWHNASTKFNAKHAVARKAMQGRPEAESLSQQRDRELYPRHVVTGWSGIVDGAGELVPFSEASCREFLEALPPWIFDEVRVFAVTAANFLEEDAPTAEEVRETAGN